MGQSTRCGPGGLPKPLKHGYMTAMHSAKFLVLLASLSIVACKKDTPPPATPAPEPVAEAEPAPEPEPEPAAEDPSDVHIEGDHLTIDKKIHFGTDSDEILDDSTEILDHIAQALANHKELSTVHVVGHTDSTGDDAHNLDLSQRRAAAVVAALRERGVTQTIDDRGAGETEPTCSDKSDECHEKNRRVEFVVEKSE